eukprot:5733241-Amphidinium_carterae.1
MPANTQIRLDQQGGTRRSAGTTPTTPSNKACPPPRRQPYLEGCMTGILPTVAAQVEKSSQEQLSKLKMNALDLGRSLGGCGCQDLSHAFLVNPLLNE